LGCCLKEDHVLVEELWKEHLHLVGHPWHILEPVGCVVFIIHNIVYSIKLSSCALLYLWSYSVWPGSDVHSFIYAPLILSTLSHFHLHFRLTCQYWDSSCLIDFEIHNFLFMMQLTF